MITTLLLKKTFRFSVLLAFVLMTSVTGYAQRSISTNTAVTEPFNIGNTASAALPTGFRIGTNWTSGTTATTLAYGTTGTGVVNGSSGGGAINWANGITASSTDRAIGFLSSGSYSSPRSIIFAFTNDTGGTVGSLTVSWNYEKYRSGSRAFAWTFFHGDTPTASNALTDGNHSYPADANNTVISNPPLSVSKSVTIEDLEIADGETYYLRWTYTGDGGNTNAQGLAIDDFSITLNAGASAPTVTTASVSDITTTSATAGGEVTEEGTSAVTERGVAYGTTANPTSGVVSGSGTGAFSADLEGLSVNTQYFYRAYATSESGTSYGSENSFFTRANVPGIAILSNPTTSSLDISIAATDGNPSNTEYAIREIGGQYVQANGTLGNTAYWQTAAEWDTTSVNSLESGLEYTFVVLARNGDGIETEAGEEGVMSTLALTDPFLEVTDVNLDFGALCLNSSDIGVMTISGINLTSNVSVGALDGFSYSSLPDLPFSETFELEAVAGEVNSTIYVKFEPTAAQSYDGNISVSGGGAIPTLIAVSGSGIATVASEVFTLTATSLTSESAVLNANLEVSGVCPDIMEKGFVFAITSENNNPVIGDATSNSVSVSGVTAGNYNFVLNTLANETEYSFRAYVKDQDDVYTYGDVLTFSTVASTPAAATDIVFGTYTENSIELSWTNGSGANRIVVARTSATAAVAPVNGNQYASNSSSFTDELNASTGDGNIVVYNGTADTVVVTDLPTGTYAFDIYEFNGNASTAGYSIALSGIKATLAAEPTVQASNITFSNVSGSRMTINWTPGNGGNSLVVVKAGSEVDAIPVDGVNYSASNTNNPYTNGEEITDGNYVVYRASLGTVTVTGLSENETYHVAIYTYSGTSGSSTVNYLTESPATASVTATTPTYYSQGSGAVNILANWNSDQTGAGEIPPSFAGIFIIQPGHEMTTGANWAFGTAGSRLEISEGARLTATSAVTINAAATFRINDGGTYVHSVGTAMSTSIFNGSEEFATNSNFIYTVPPNGTSGLTGGYGNLTFSITTGSAATGLSGNITEVKGNFLVTNTNNQNIRLSNNNTTLNIGGNFTVTGGNLSLQNSSGESIVTVGGDLTVSGGILNLANSTGAGILNVAGNIALTGGSVLRSGNSPASKIVFTGDVPQTYVGGATLGPITFEVATGAIADLGTSTVAGTGVFRVMNDASVLLGSTSPAGAIAGNITATGGLQIQGISGVIYNAQDVQYITPRADYAILGIGGSGEKIFLGNTTTSVGLIAGDNPTVIVPSTVSVTTPRLIVEPTATMTFENNASLIQTEDLDQNSGEITIKRNTLVNRLDYVYWSSPVAGQNLHDFSPLTSVNRFYQLDEQANAFAAVDPMANDFIPAQGYMVRAPNTYQDYPAAKQLFTGVFTGEPNSGNITVSTTKFGNGFNMIGNPYPSPVSAELFFNENADVNAIHFWAHQTLAGGGVNYGAYNRTGPVANDFNIVPNGIIQTGQGFLAEVENAGVVTFTNEMRVADTQDQFFRGTPVEQNRIWLNLTQDNTMINQTLVGYVEKATNELDGQYDAKLTDKAGSRLYSIVGERSLVIQGRALPFTNTDVVALGFNAAAAGNYTVSIDHVDGLFTIGQDIFINDLMTGTVHNLLDGAYTFASQAGDFANRFQLQYVNTTLGDDTDITADNVVIFGKNGMLTVNTGNNTMQTVKVFDIRGRMLFEQNDVNQKQTSFAVQSAQQVLIVQVTSNGKTISKKVVY